MTAPEFALSKYASRDDMHSDMLATIHSLRQQLSAAQCAGCAVQQGTHKPAGAVHRIAESAAQAVEADLPDVEDMAHSAVQEALSHGLSHDVLHRWMRAVMDKTVEALRATPPAPAAVDVADALRMLIEAIEFTPLGVRQITALTQARAALAAPQAQDVQRDALTHAELLEVRRAVGDFVDCEETDVHYRILLRAAQAGYLECTHFTVANVDALDAAIAASAAKGGEA